MSSSSSRSKKSNPSSSSSSTKSSSTKERQRLMTFRYNESEVWVKLDSYQSAISTAQSEFDELRSIPPSRIAFYVKFLDSGKLVRISESAWSSMLPKFAERSVIDIKLREERDTKSGESPPGYFHLELPEDSTCQKSAQLRPPVAHSSSSTSVASGTPAGGRHDSLHDKISKLIRR
ncbi:hypothetical protein D9619_001923 [Psilocybe cf. subviscida]|uniref:Uncharacterized protein n=1 Tax=Psilocybe cf. subviscida TaxID=2480587 RepID=A0A8H5F418_9AGAR|nr:hypothetical protein D9619_001923 [Psilocybe cf. subviscida]